MNASDTLKTGALVFVLGLAGGFAGYALSHSVCDSNNNTPASEAPANNEIHLASMPSYFSSATPTEFTTAAEKCIDGVVHVKTKYYQDNGYDDPFFQYFFGMPSRPNNSAQASGSGVIISSDGYIVTNNHVIENSTEIEVVLNDRRSYEATLIGRDPSTDLALLKIEAESLKAIPFGSSDNLKVGEWVLAIGNPFNLTSTVTSGIVSAKARNINILDSRKGAIESFIQTDAAVNPGNSGGALVNTNGELVGINTAIASQTGSFTGYAFAVPTTIVKKVIADLKEYGKVQRAIIGISIADVTSEEARENNLGSMDGVMIKGVMENTAADDAGLKEGDIILSINGKATKTCPELQEVVSTFRPGDKASVEFVHNGNRRVTEVTFKDMDNNMNPNAPTKTLELYGATFEKADKKVMKELNISNGVSVKEIESGKFLSAGVRKGFIITKINNTPISEPSEISTTIKNVGRNEGIYIEGIYPNGRKSFYAFGM